MSKSRITNPRKLRKIAALLGRDVAFAWYRGGYSTPELGHFFVAFCNDGTAWYVNSRLNKFEQDNDPPPAAQCVDGTTWTRANT